MDLHGHKGVGCASRSLFRRLGGDFERQGLTGQEDPTDLSPHRLQGGSSQESEDKLDVGIVAVLQL